MQGELWDGPIQARPTEMPKAPVSKVNGPRKPVGWQKTENDEEHGGKPHNIRISNNSV